MFNPAIDVAYYVASIFIFILGFFISRKKIRNGKGICFGILIAYCFLVLSSTVFCRAVNETYKYRLVPFWSYYWVLCNFRRWKLLVGNLLNIVLMMPVGILLPHVFRKINLMRIAFLALAFELIIETLQLITKTGIAEWDDMIHGVIGSMIGYGIAKLLQRWRRSNENENITISSPKWYC
jgi:glycopeptide antibiotics resistance protein